MKKIIFVLTSAALLLVYQNCGQTGYGSDSHKEDYASLTTSDYKTSNPVALLSYEQVFKSMASVTGVPTTNGTVNNEFSRRQGLLASGYDLSGVTSPMLIGITNLGSTFCGQLINSEKAMAAASRKFFIEVDFTKGADMLSESIFMAAVQRMALAFWGRPANATELSYLAAARSDFLSDFTATEVKSTTASNNLTVFACTAMLASADSFTF
jgi:hypothetical protein